MIEMVHLSQKRCVILVCFEKCKMELQLIGKRTREVAIAQEVSVTMSASVNSSKLVVNPETISGSSSECINATVK